MTPFYDKCISVVLKSEGGYQCHPEDIGNYTPSGELKGTKYGISSRLFPQEDIKNLTKDRAKFLFWKYYWKPMNIEGIVDPDLVLHVFDFGINAGKRLSIRTLQRLVNTKADGIIGPITTRKANEFPCVIKCGTPYDLVDFFREARKVYYMDLANRKPQYKVFLKGWLRRIEKTKFDETV